LKDDVSALSILFMRRSVGKLMFISSVRRSLSFLFLIFLTNSSAWHPAMAQTLKNLEGAVNIFGQFSGTSNGNGVQDKPTYSLGVLANVRQSFHPWLGYEVNYGYTRYTERYATPVFPVHVQDNMHEASGAYLVQGPSIPFLGLQPFGGVGLGALVFLPTTVGGQKYNQQTRLAFLYEFGVNYPILTSHLGLRLQYRGLSYKTPDFNASLLTTNARRQTSEPSVGAYFRF
jgi:opacity protein-like surface antigen